MFNSRTAVMASLFLLPMLAFSKTYSKQASHLSSSFMAIDSLPEGTYETPFERVEVESSVDAAEWRKHLEKELQPVIEKAARKGLRVGVYIVNVRFVVEKDGSLSDVKALNDPGHGLAKGAVAVVRSGPKWKPGEQNGKKVRSYHTQPITFVIAEE
jgi:protein TonB